MFLRFVRFINLKKEEVKNPGLYRWRRAIWRIAIWMPSVPSGNDTLPPLPSGGIKYMLLVVNYMLLNVNYMLLIVKYMV